jgi:hypothetical protein
MIGVCQQSGARNGLLRFGMANQHATGIMGSMYMRCFGIQVLVAVDELQ